MDGNDKRLDEMVAMLLGIQGLADVALRTATDDVFLKAIVNNCEIHIKEVEYWQNGN